MLHEGDYYSISYILFGFKRQNLDFLYFTLTEGMTFKIKAVENENCLVCNSWKGGDKIFYIRWEDGNVTLQETFSEQVSPPSPTSYPSDSKEIDKIRKPMSVELCQCMVNYCSDQEWEPILKGYPHSCAEQRKENLIVLRPGLLDGKREP